MFKNVNAVAQTLQGQNVNVVAQTLRGQNVSTVAQTLQGRTSVLLHKPCRAVPKDVVQLLSGRFDSPRSHDSIPGRAVYA